MLLAQNTGVQTGLPEVDDIKMVPPIVRLIPLTNDLWAQQKGEWGQGNKNQNNNLTEQKAGGCAGVCIFKMQRFLICNAPTMLFGCLARLESSLFKPTHCQKVIFHSESKQTCTVLKMVPFCTALIKY